MQRKKTTERYLFDDIGRICGKEVTEEFYSEGDLAVGKGEEVVDIEPEVPKINWEDPNEVTLYDSWTNMPIGKGTILSVGADKEDK